MKDSYKAVTGDLKNSSKKAKHFNAKKKEIRDATKKKRRARKKKS